MRKIRFVMECFAMITSCVLFAVAIFTTIIFPAEAISPFILWQILLVSFLCAVSTLIYPWEKKIKKNIRILQILIHYAAINVIVLACGSIFDWYDTKNAGNILTMVILIAVIFIIVSVVSWNKGIKEAKAMNEKLKEYQEIKYKI